MKIRHGFVSNSSTTSFSIYGIYLSEEDLKKRKLTEHIYIMPTGSEIDIYIPPYSEDAYIGKSWSKIKDEETGKQFKENTKEIIRKYFSDVKDDEFCTMESGWYDG